MKKPIDLEIQNFSICFCSKAQKQEQNIYQNSIDVDITQIMAEQTKKTYTLRQP